MLRRTSRISSILGVIAFLSISSFTNAQEQQQAMRATPTPTPLAVPTTGAGSIPGKNAVFAASPAKITGGKLLNLADLAYSNTTPPKIIATGGGSVYDMNALTGVGSNFKTPTLSGISMHQFVGIAYAANNTLYGLTSAYSPEQYPYRSRLFTIDAAHNTLGIGPALNIGGNSFVCGREGDLAYDSSAAKMYATCFDGVWKLVSINLGAGNVTIVGTMPGPGISAQFTALAFSPKGDLYALDTNNRKLWKLNKTNLAASVGIPLTPSVGVQLPNTSTTGGMGFSAAGVLYTSFGGVLATIEPVNGVITVVGNSGSSGMIVTGGSVDVKHN